MRYSKTENIRVKNQIVNGLFTLLQNTPFSAVTISELVKTANVARASYYRNFNNKEEILDYYFQSLRLRRNLTKDQDISLDYEHFNKGFEEAFKLFLNEKQRITLLFNNGLSSYIYDWSLDQVIAVVGNMPANSPERYRINFFAGSIFSVLSEWLLSGTRESPREMSDILSKYLMHGVL
ncbi:TetR/AcrR family transcriptional regulator [Lactiplantibacillus daowaiensis]|uniref:TetR/AcrR family transcriptional regulator n=1 Tax=Lactiplantibacillus daowaiensis TaxID=2559918 RepID=A0ABW1RWS1_9LACO|nr:TetR/AcrR family transcriptional regulator [Lactiplantibacillus daowaiensis]